MHEREFTKPSGKLVDARFGEYKYFLPDAPPLRIKLKQDTTYLLTEAAGKLGMLAGAGTLLPNPHILISPYITKEAVLSSKIEGTQASLSDVLKFQARDEKEEKKGSDVREVQNYVNALEYGLKKIQTSKINYALIKEMHRILLEDVRGQSKDPGEFRKVQNWIGTAGRDISGAIYIPPAPEALIKPLHDFMDYIEIKGSIPLLVQTALLHYHFEATHPFSDGNGRIGRVLITLFLCKRKALSEPLLYLSAFFEKHRQEYYRRLLAVSQKSDYEGWIKFFLKGIVTQSEDSLNRAIKLTQLREKYRDKLLEMKAVSNALIIADELFTNPFISISKVKQILKTTYPTAKKAIDDLVTAGVLTEITGKERYRLFCATEVLDILEI